MKRLNFNRVLAGLALSFAAVLPVQAGPVITFDLGLDTSNVWFPPLLGHGDALIQGDFFVGTVSTKSGAAFGDLVGALVDGTDVVNTCVSVGCPTNNLTTFLGMLNDGLPYVARLDGFGFQIKSFDASFIAASGVVVPTVSLLMRVVGFTSDGGVFFEDALLPGPVGGAYSFSTYNLSSTFSSRSYVEVDFYGYSCNSAGSCSRSGDTAQFALDNIAFLDAAVVPEPSSLALFGLAIAGLSFVRRRRTINS